MDSEISFSRAETCLIMEPRLSNPHGTAHGGEQKYVEIQSKYKKK